MKIIGLAAALTLALAGTAFADGDAKKGERVFKKCKACHQVGEDAKNRVGPMLNGIVGSVAGGVDGFKYSSALTEAAGGGLTWTEENMAEFLTKPKKFMPGTKMTFAGLRKEADRANVIAFLMQYE